MDTICLNDIKTLIQKGGGAHVSIFMPTHHRGGEDPQDPIRLRNLLRKAEEKLTTKGLRSAEARLMLAPADKLLTDNLFWRQQSEGLALFLDTNTFMYFRVPLVLKEEVGVGERYYIKPLIPLMTECNLFYVLAISREENRLLQCTGAGSVRMNLGATPKNMEEALHYDVPGNRMQYHVSAPAGGSNFGGATAIQKGEGSRQNYDKRNIQQYLDQIDKGVIKALKEDKSPMVLAAVDYLHPLYRTANSYQNLLAEGILGNPDGVADDTLREQAWAIVRTYFTRARHEAVADYMKASGSGHATKGLVDTLTAAYSGRIRFLFLAEGAQQWGSFNPESHTVTVHSAAGAGDEDLLDLAAYQTLSHAGTVYVMKPEEVPGGAPLSATMRY